MKTKPFRVPAIAFALAMQIPCVLHAAGIIPERVNQIILKGTFPDPEPAFLLICSAQPLKDSQGRLLVEICETELLKHSSNKHQVVIIEKYTGAGASCGRRRECRMIRAA